MKKVLPNCGLGKRWINVKYGDEPSISVLKQNVKDYFIAYYDPKLSTIFFNSFLKSALIEAFLFYFVH